MLTLTGRKLRCNGDKPSCRNCLVRKYECEYVEVQKRRGPGKKKEQGSQPTGKIQKAPKIIGDSDPPPTMVPDNEGSPDLRPYISVLEFQPPDGSPQHSSEPPERPMREQGSHSRTSRSRETRSGEDHSDAKDILKNPSGS